MQHVHVVKKLNFELLTQPPKFANHVAAYLFPYNLICSFWVGEGGVEVNNQNICYHVAAYLIPFNLVCNMTMF